LFTPLFPYNSEHINYSTHRERKERHLKDVERQVRILEANSAQAAGEMERLRNSMEALRDENRVLRQLLDENHILREQLEAENTPITPAAFLNAQQQQSSAMGNMSTRTNSPLTNGYLAQSHNAPGYGGAITTYHNNGVSNGQSDNAAVGYEQTNNTVNGYDQTNGGAVNYHQVDNNTVNYHQADNTAIHYGQANNTPPNYHQPDNTPFGYVQPNNSPVNYHQANNGTPGYGQNTHAAINYGQFDNTTAGHDQTDDTVATYNQLNNTAAGYGQYDNTAVNYGQTSNAAVMSQAPPMQGSTSAGQIQIFNDRSITGSARFDVNPYTVIYPPYDYANGFQWRPGMLHPALNGPNDRTFINFIVE